MAEDSWRSLFESAHVGLVVLDSRGMVRTASARAAEMLELGESPEGVGLHISDIPGAGPELARLVDEVAVQGQGARDVYLPEQGAAGARLIGVIAWKADAGEAEPPVVLLLRARAQTEDDERELHVRRLYDDAEPRMREAALTLGSVHAFLDEAARLLGETARADQVFILLSSEDADAYEEEVRWVRHRERSLVPLRLDAMTGPLSGSLERGVVHLRTDDATGPADAVEFELLESIGAVEALAIPFRIGSDRRGVVLLAHSQDAASWSTVEHEAVQRLAGLAETLLAWIRAEDRFHKVVSAIDDSLAAYSFGLDGERIFSLVTPQIERITGHPPAAFVDGRLDWGTAIVHRDDTEAVLAFERKLRDAGDGRLDYRVMTADGHTRWIRESAAPRRNLGGRVEVASIISDVTEQKEVEVELIEARRAAETANRAKSVFLTTMSHELRTPLGVIKGFTELLDEEIAGLGGASAEALEFSSVIRSNATRVLDLVVDLLDLARLQTDGLAMARAPVTVQPVIDEVIRRHATSVTDGRVSIVPGSSDSSALASADSKRLEQVIDIVLENAVKFTEAGSVTVDMTEEATSILITIRDTGIGIGPDAIDQVFEPFFQEDNSLNRAYQGSGLGLALARRLIEAMDGRIDIDSEVSTGTTVTIRLPRADT